jgi:hypothetical protein
MNKETIIKVVLGGVAVYIIYRWAASQGFFGSPAQAPAAGELPPYTPASTSVVAAPRPLGPGDPVPPPAPPRNVNPNPPAANQFADPSKAATDPAYAAQSPLRFTVDQWNYYRGAAGMPIKDALLYPGVTPDNRGSITIAGSDYHAWVNAAGVSGVRMAGGLGGAFWGGLTQ